MNEINIKLATIADAEFIALLGRVTFTETFGHLFRDRNDLWKYCNYTFSVEKIRNGISKPTNIFWIAFIDELPVGYSNLKLNTESEFIESKKVCQLQKIYVLRDYLSMKIGLELQIKLLETAKERKFEKIWLSVLGTNDRAINFYIKNGFKKIGDHGFQIGKEKFKFIAMSKNLD